MLFRKRSGFSLVELMTVLSVVIIMSSWIYPKVSDYLQFSKVSAAKSGAASLATSVTQYKFEVGTFPVNLTALTGKAGNCGPWIVLQSLKDPWGQSYNYVYEATSGKYAVWSNGSNGTNNSGGGLSGIAGDDQGTICIYK